MKTLETDTTGVTIPRFASCLIHGRYGVSHDARLECPYCLKERQSVTRYGLSNAIDAPVSGALLERAAVKVLMAALVAIVIGMSSLALLLHRERDHLDAAVARIERAGR